MEVIIDYEKQIIKDLKGYYEVTGYNKSLGFTISLDSLNHYQQGNKLTEEEEDYINKLYQKIFLYYLFDIL